MTKRIEVLNDYVDNDITIISQEPYCIVGAPRTHIDDLHGFLEVEQPGIYILSDDDGKTLYVGQARSGTYKRLRQHNKDADKHWFTHITVVSKVGNPISAEQLNYIEKEFIRIAAQTGSIVKNKTLGNSSTLSGFKTSQADAFINDTTLLLDMFFDSLPSNLPLLSFCESKISQDDITVSSYERRNDVLNDYEMGENESSQTDTYYHNYPLDETSSKDSKFVDNRTVDTETEMIQAFNDYKEYLNASKEDNGHSSTIKYNHFQEPYNKGVRYENDSSESALSKWFKKRIIG